MTTDIRPPVRRIRIVGAGVMGAGIAQLAATSGFEVELTDANPGATATAAKHISDLLDRAVAKGRLNAQDARDALARLSIADNPRSRTDAGLVIEAVKEDLQVKHEVLRAIEASVRRDTIIATNTSSFAITEVASALDRPQLLAGLHFFNPAPLMRVVEVIPGLRTDAEVVDTLVGVVTSFGHRPVVASDSPGFIVNHAGRGLLTEALQVLDEGVARPEDVDRVAREILGLRMGPFELMDLTGLDVTHPVLESLWQGFYGDPRLRPSPTTRLRAQGGVLGRKSGGGFYAYSEGQKQEPVEATPPAYSGQTVWTDAPELSSLLEESGVSTVATPDEADVVVVAHDSGTVVEAVASRGLPRDKVVAIDPVAVGATSRATLATSVATDVKSGRAAVAALAHAGLAVTVTGDTPVPLATRLLASIVNTAAEIAHRGIATPADIDDAVRLGLGYPRGPLTWGDEFGASRLADALDAMVAATGDPRYRTSRWMRDRVASRLPLVHVGVPLDQYFDREEAKS